jgi:hypothetical protein
MGDGLTTVGHRQAAVRVVLVVGRFDRMVVING